MTGTPLQWDIFCRVIDNFGDIGVCWRLARNLVAEHGQRVRLWVDDASSLAWMAAPDERGLVEVHAWPGPHGHCPPGDVLLETFGCDLPLAFQSRPGVWINLEHLSAEPYIERCHRLPSPIMAGPGAGRTRWFFYPGFTPQSGGLLREAHLARQQPSAVRAAWRARHGIAPQDLALALFCYPDAAPFLKRLLGQCAPRRIHLMCTPGHARRALHRALAHAPLARRVQQGSLVVHALPACPQAQFDDMLLACDLNLVRGEDSLVRALWAGQPFLWHIYAQPDQAHHAKLHAFLDWLACPPAVRAWMLACCALLPPGAELPALDGELLDAWSSCVQAARTRLAARPSLSAQLLAFALEKWACRGAG